MTFSITARSSGVSRSAGLAAPASPSTWALMSSTSFSTAPRRASTRRPRLVPDPLNYGWRDYGPRVGIWRLVESLDRHGMRASVLLNSEVPDRYPQLVEAGRARGLAGVPPGREKAPLPGRQAR